MAEIHYSPDALNILSLFHSAEFSVFVEGDDDEEFWSQVLDLAGIKGYHIESVGGKERLGNILDSIEKDNAQVIVAADRDYSDYLDESKNNIRFVKTHGHSIENCLYCKSSLSRIISKLSRKRNKADSYLNNWEKEFLEKATELIRYDIANIRYSKGITVIGDNCCRFLSSNNSYSLNKKKIDSHINSIRNSFTVDEMQKIDEMMRSDKRSFWHIIKGHFITHSSLNIVKYVTKKISGRQVTLSVDSFYALAVDGCTACGIRCQAIQEMIDQVRSAWLSLDINIGRH